MMKIAKVKYFLLKKVRYFFPDLTEICALS